MQSVLGEYPVPPSSEAMKELLERTFEELVGVPVTSTADPYVERYAHGGMSSGRVSMKFWRDTALPLLLRRSQAP